MAPSIRWLVPASACASSPGSGDRYLGAPQRKAYAAGEEVLESPSSEFC
jgi:hypothetical protein